MEKIVSRYVHEGLFLYALEQLMDFPRDPSRMYYTLLGLLNWNVQNLT